MVLSVANERGDSFRRWTWRRPMLYADEYVGLAALEVLVLLVFLAAMSADVATGRDGFVLHLCFRAVLPWAVLALAEHVGRRQPRFGRRLVYAGAGAMLAVLTVDLIVLCCTQLA